MRILVVRNNSNPKAVDASLLLVAYLTSQGIDYLLCDSSELTGAGDSAMGGTDLVAGVDLVVVLGGDGTILRTARQVGTSGIPLLGINFGRLGFLANSSEPGVVALVADALAGDVKYELRTNICVEVLCKGDIDRWEEVSLSQTHNCYPLSEQDGASLSDQAISHNPSSAHPSSPRRFFALNELAVTRGANGRIIDFSLSIAGCSLAQMRGDGLIIASATGSTAYALSGGGPLVAPEFNGLVVVPLAAHTLHSRSFVTSSSDVVAMDLLHRTPAGEVSLFVDGELLTFEKSVERIYVSCGEAPTVLLRHQHEGFYHRVSRAFF